MRECPTCRGELGIEIINQVVFWKCKECDYESTPLPQAEPNGQFDLQLEISYGINSKSNQRRNKKETIKSKS